MPIVIATINAPSAQVATAVSKMIGRRFSLVDEAGTARDGTKADLEAALRTTIREWFEQDRAQEAAKAAKATEVPLDLT